MTSALSHIKVLDLSRSAGYPGGYLTSLLVDLGADVVKVEPPGRGDPLRINFLGGDEPAAAHLALNRGKRSITLETRSEQATAVLERLLATADVVIETNKPGSSLSPGLDYERANEVNPRIIWCSLSGFGQDGPYAERPGHDLTYLAQSGLLATLDPSHQWLPNAMLGVPMGAMVSVIGILAALERRHQTGLGGRVDTAISESASWLLSGMPHMLSGNPINIPFTADRRTYRCSDGAYVAVAAAEPKTWALFCEGIGAPELIETLHAPPVRNQEVQAQIETIMVTRSAAEWVALLGPLGAAVGPVNENAAITNDPQHVARGTIVHVEGVPVPAGPVHLYDADGTAATPTVTAAPPGVGEHTDEELTACGFSSDEIASLRDAGVI